MIDSTYHVEIDGTKYKLAEDAEATHHNVKGEPLRPPNAVTVQGENSQKFQMRPDTLLWSWTDWSAGEGRRRLQFLEGGRSWQLNGVRAFEDPGHLIPGYYTETTQDTTGAADLTKSLSLAVARGNLYGLDTNAATIYLWSIASSKWGAPAGLAGVTAGAGDNAVGDGTAIYWVERGTNNVYKRTTGTVTKISDTLIGTATTVIGQLTDYVYVYEPSTAKIWEIPKTGDTGVEIDSWTEPGQYAGGHSLITTLDAKLYVMVSQKGETSIREIIPSTAAGTGFGAEILRIKGFEGEALWSHSGNLFMLGKYEDSDTTRTILYNSPGGAYGTLGEVRAGEAMLTGSGGAMRMLDHFWVQQNLESGTAYHALMQADAVTGGLACLSYDEADGAPGDKPQSVVAYEGDIFWSVRQDATTKLTMRADAGRYQINSSAISPFHDFDFSGNKYLGSMELSVAPLPADWTVYVDYEKNNDGTWVNAITYSTTSGTGTTATITTDSTTINFRTLRLRVRFAYTGGGIPTSAPLLLGIDTRASVSDTILVFNYLLDLSDDHSAGSQSKAGETKVDSFQATIAKTDAIDLKDGYTSKRAGVYDQYDVTVEKFDLLLTKPGEGMGYITLREVV